MEYERAAELRIADRVKGGPISSGQLYLRAEISRLRWPGATRPGDISAPPDTSTAKAITHHHRASFVLSELYKVTLQAKGQQLICRSLVNRYASMAREISSSVIRDSSGRNKVLSDYLREANRRLFVLKWWFKSERSLVRIH